MNPGRQKRISKRVSYVLRHCPDSIGLPLDEAGWADVDALLKGLRIEREILVEVVENNPKRRFEFDASGTRIRARQGHSVEVDLGYQPQVPPDVLFHGTPEANLASIRESGLHRAGRHHVHLSTDRALMLEVGRRRGKPALVTVDAARMHADGHQFFLTENGVWLTEAVPAEYLVWEECEL